MAAWPLTAWLGETMLLALVAACLLITSALARRKSGDGLDSKLLLICTLTAMLVPPVSHDYKLALLAAPVVLVLVDYEAPDTFARQLAGSAMLAVLSGAYALTLVSYTVRP